MIRTEKAEEYANRLHTVMAIKILSGSLFILRLEKRDVHFRPGQFALIGLPGDRVKREYSIYSAPGDPFIDLLIREVPDGDLSSRLRSLKVGQQVILDGPAGDFILPVDWSTDTFLFIASGTGVSPFHSMVRSNPKIPYRMLLGFRGEDDLLLSSGFQRDRLILCSSRDDSGDFRGYVTDYLRAHIPDPKTEVFLCGNGNMVYEAFHILTANGFNREQLHTEIFF